MSILNEIANIPAESLHQQSASANKKNFREGYFAWEAEDCIEKETVVFAILPPFKEWFGERITAAKTGKIFTTNFFINHGLHSVGASDRDKLYADCRRIATDRKGNGDLIKLDDNSCPMCDICWDEIWPRVEETKPLGKDNPAYKGWDRAFRLARPQEKCLFNIIVYGKTTPKIFDCPKTLRAQLEKIHTDKMLPDLLWPTDIGAVKCTWIKVVRTKGQDSTTFSAVPVMTGTPHVANPNGSFNEAGYISILNSMKDLREEMKRIMPDKAHMDKMVAKLRSLVSIKLKNDNEIETRVAAAVGEKAPEIDPALLSLGAKLNPEVKATPTVAAVLNTPKEVAAAAPHPAAATPIPTMPTTVAPAPVTTAPPAQQVSAQSQALSNELDELLKGM